MNPSDIQLSTKKWVIRHQSEFSWEPQSEELESKRAPELSFKDALWAHSALWVSEEK